MPESQQTPPPARVTKRGATGAAVPRSPRARAYWWSAALASVPVFVFLGATLNPRWWRFLAVNHMRPFFLDLIAILAAGQAYVAGLNPYAENPFDPMGRPHVYGPLWLGVGHLGLTVADAPWLGGLLALIFVLVLAIALRPRTRGTFVVAALLLSSPPTLLALDRGNNDLIVVLLLVAGAWTLARPGWARFAGGTGFLLLAAALKMYPLATLPVLVGNRHTRATLLICAAAALACVLGWWDWRTEYQHALSLAPQPTTIAAYGLYVSYLTWNSLFATRLWLIAGATVTILVFGIPLGRRIRNLWSAVPLSGFRATAFVIGALCWIVCYLFASNYRYRFILLFLPAMLWLGQLRRNPEQSAAPRWQLAGWVAVGWLTVLMNTLAIASLQPQPGSSLRWLTAVVGFEQMLVLILTLCLSVSVAGWFFRSGTRLLTTVRTP